MYRCLQFIAWILVCALLIPVAVQACPSCKLVEDPIARGFNWSILFLMAMPFTVVGLIGGSVFYLYNRAGQADNHPSRTDAD